MSDANFNFSILVIDDDDAMRYGLSRELKKCGCTVTESESVEDAVDLLATSTFDLVFCDMRFPGAAGGEELLKHVRQQVPGTAVALISCAMDDKRKHQLLSDGASYCIEKPIFKAQCITLLSSLTGEATMPKAA